jgi:hypothetical protein
MNRWNQKSKSNFSLSGKTRICNLCARNFVPLTAFDRYCPNCKSGSELLKFSEWLPEAEPTVSWAREKIAA